MGSPRSASRFSTDAKQGHSPPTLDPIVNRLDREALNALRLLYVANRDAQFGFALCGMFVSDAALRTVLRRRALQCRAATEMLASMLADSLADLARPQGWALTVGKQDNDRSILEKYREGESRVLIAYRDTLDTSLPAGWRVVLQQHFEAALDQYQDVSVASRAAGSG